MLATKLLLLLLLSTQVFSTLVCGACQASINTFAKVLSFVIPDFVAIEALDALCMRRYDSQKLCKRVGQEIAPLAISNFIENHVNSDKICSFACDSSFIYYNSDAEVERILKGGPPSPLDLSKYVQRQQFEVDQKPIINVLHISDIHQDMNYVVNSSTNCEYPICCHAENGFPENPSTQAKPLGNKNCDSPPELLDSFLGFMGKQAKIDVIVATGDYSAHNEWEKTEKSILETETQIEQKLRRTFPGAILIKSEGNNDYIPDHQFDGAKNPDLLKVTTVKNGQTQLTFVAINTIAFDEMNLYLMGDQSYAIFQLMLLQQILNTKDNVYLLGHILVTLSGVAEQYAKVFRALVARYSTKIKGQFYGHTHSDQLTVNTYPNTETATGFSWVAPSLSPLYVGSSRSRIYKLSVGDQNGVIDYAQYAIKDLGASVGQWKIQYKFREKYHLGQEDKPVTLAEIDAIKRKTLESKVEQKKYLRTSGLEAQFGDKVHCNLIDDPVLRKKCANRSPTLNDKISYAISMLTGKWGYRKKLAQ